MELNKSDQIYGHAVYIFINMDCGLLIIYILNILTGCDPIPILEHATPDRVYRGVDSVITYTCDAGYIFAAGGTLRTIVCLPNGVWSSPITDCVCE